MSDINSLEQRLYNVDFNNLIALEKLNNDAKSELKNDSSLSLEQRTLILNTITVLNEVIINTTNNQLREDEQDLKLFYDNALLTSVTFLSNVPSEDKDQLINGFNQSLQNVDALWRGLAEGDSKEKAKNTLEDLMNYGTRFLTATADHVEEISASLNELDPTIEMLSTTGDGNCFYNAISTTDWLLQNPGQSVASNNKHEDRHVELRKKTTEYMTKLKVRSTEVESHSSNRYWATEGQIQYLAGAEEKPILVLALNPQKKGEMLGCIYSKKNISVVDPNELRVIVNINNVHFNALNTTIEARERLIELYDIVPVE